MTTNLKVPYEVAYEVFTEWVNTKPLAVGSIDAAQIKLQEQLSPGWTIDELRTEFFKLNNRELRMSSFTQELLETARRRIYGENLDPNDPGDVYWIQNPPKDPAKLWAEIPRSLTDHQRISK